jgi:tyrosyl-tRNA synthetase
LIEGLDGVRKMSKSFDNYVALTEPADEMFGKLMSLPDGLIAKYELLCTNLGAADNARVVAGLADGSIHPNAEKRRMARTIVERYHGPGSGEAAEMAFDKVFRAHETPDDIPEVGLPADAVTDGTVWLPKALVAAGLATSNGEGRRAIEQGGVRIDGEPVSGDRMEVPVGALMGRVLQVGRRKFAKIVSIG